VSERDDEIIAKYLNGDDAQFMRETAEALGGIDRVENGCFIMADGTPVGMQPKSMFERWAEESESLPNGGWEILDDSEKMQALA
jgi:hypothetical protein